MRILLVKTSSLGDVVHNLPVASDLARIMPEAAIDWVVEEGFADIPRLHPGVHRVIPVALRRWRNTPFSLAVWREIGEFGHLLRSEAYDFVVDTQGLIKSALIARAARLTNWGRRCGFAANSAREPLAARFYDTGYTVPRTLHAVERNRQLAGAAFGYPARSTADYGISAVPLDEAWLPTGKHAVLLTGTSRADKLWPEDHWIALGNVLAQQGLIAVLPAGSEEERSRANRLATRIPGAVVAPPRPVAQLARLFAGAQVTVGLDTGLSHLAAALGRPSVALFSGSNPALTGLHAGDRALNLSAAGRPVAVVDVLSGVAQVLSKAPFPPTSLPQRERGAG